MKHIEQLSNKVKNLLPKGVSEDLTVTDGGLFFLTNVFKDGCLLGFWSHSPRSTCHDQEQGWVVLSTDLTILDECETKSDGISVGNDFRGWRKNQTELHGKSFKLMPEWGGEQFWKISEC